MICLKAQKEIRLYELMKVILRETFMSKATLLSFDVKAFALLPAQSWEETVCMRWYVIQENYKLITIQALINITIVFNILIQQSNSFHVCVYIQCLVATISNIKHY